ncbi:MAG: hypothetical protein IJX47_05205, partial [Clostridia bacterium]|nr:hypothetical protein [Clostridia bacterium]
QREKLSGIVSVFCIFSQFVSLQNFVCLNRMKKGASLDTKLPFVFSLGFPLRGSCHSRRRQAVSAVTDEVYNEPNE